MQQWLYYAVDTLNDESVDIMSMKGLTTNFNTTLQARSTGPTPI